MVTASFIVDTTEIATQLAEAVAGIGSLVGGFKMIELAKDYYGLYQQQREFYYSTFQTGVESPLISEVNGVARYNTNYAGRVGTIYNGVTGPFGGSVTDTVGWWDRHAKMYHTSRDSKITALEPDVAKIKSDWTNYMFRFEEEWTDIRNDIRWNKRLAIHNYGVKQGAAISGALNTSLNEYQNHIADFSSQLATYGNGIAKYVGYRRGLADTADDFNSQDRVYNTPTQSAYAPSGIIGSR